MFYYFVIKALCCYVQIVLSVEKQYSDYVLLWTYFHTFLPQQETNFAVKQHKHNKNIKTLEILKSAGTSAYMQYTIE